MSQSWSNGILGLTVGLDLAAPRCRGSPQGVQLLQ